MLQVLINYRRYRATGFGVRKAWELAGVQHVVLPFIRGVAIAAIALATLAVIGRGVEANQMTADNRVAAKVAQQATYIKDLETLLAKCLSPGDNAVSIGGELFFCGAAATGVLLK